MKLYLIRHGQTDWNVAGKIQGSTDIPLNDMGRRQAACLARGMEKRPVEKVFTSTLSRAYETGLAIGKSQNVPVEQLEGLEEVGYGVWEGMTMEEIQEQYPKELELWYNSPVDVAPRRGRARFRCMTGAAGRWKLYWPRPGEMWPLCPTGLRWCFCWNICLGIPEEMRTRILL